MHEDIPHAICSKGPSSNPDATSSVLQSSCLAIGIKKSSIRSSKRGAQIGDAVMKSIRWRVALLISFCAFIELISRVLRVEIPFQWLVAATCQKVTQRGRCQIKTKRRSPSWIPPNNHHNMATTCEEGYCTAISGVYQPSNLRWATTTADDKRPL